MNQSTINELSERNAKKYAWKSMIYEKTIHAIYYLKLKASTFEPHSVRDNIALRVN